MKKILLSVLAFCLLFCAAAYAERVAIALPGSGTQADPYQIATKEDLLQLAAFVNQEYNAEDYDDLSAHYVLTADIALNDCADFENWDANPPELNWMPIGYERDFRGVFDGNGYTISGLYIHRDVEQFSYGPNSRFGLFGYVSNNGSIRNLNITNAYVHPKYVQGLGGTNTGILAGESSGTVSGCSVEGVLVCEGGVYGGIAGSNSGEIADCSFAGKMIERTAYVNNAMGGIAGSAGAISDCSVSAELISEKTTDELLVYAEMGGIAGMMSSANTIRNCVFTGTIRSEGDAGGILGSASAFSMPDDGEKKGQIINCVNEGSVTAAGDAGGIVGVCMDRRDTPLWIDSCVNRGEVKCTAEDVYAVGGIVGGIDTRNGGDVIVSNCTNEAELSNKTVGGIVGRAMQNTGNILVEHCTNKAVLRSEGFYVGGVLGSLQQWGGDWSVIVDRCVNDGDLYANSNAGGIVCFTYDVDPAGKGRSLTISDCVNRGKLTSSGSNSYMGGILGTDGMQNTPVKITGCVNEGDLEYTHQVMIDADTLQNPMFTLSRISGGVVGYAGTTPFLTVNSGDRVQNNINVENAYLTVENCASRGKFIHKEPKFTEDAYAVMTENWTDADTEYVMSFFIAIEGGVVGTISDEENYSVNIVDCTFENAGEAISSWIIHER